MSTENGWRKASVVNPTAGIIIIGDEILKGQIIDSNSHFLCRRLFTLGVDVKKIAVVPDDQTCIAAEVSEFCQKYTHVITAGGIGPTHDDVTVEAVAKAFGEKTKPHPELIALLKVHFGTEDVTSPKFKMAYIPESAALHFGIDRMTGRRSKFPVVVLKNVYMFPGIPMLMERAFDMLEDLFRNPDSEFYVKELYIVKDEVLITDMLNEINTLCKDKVIIGSYPEFGSSYYKVKVTLQAPNKQDVDDAEALLRNKLPPESFVNYEPDPVGHAEKWIYDLVKSRDNSVYERQVRHAVEVVEQALEKYSLDVLCVGFNGGKDCTALLHLVHAVVKHKFPSDPRQLKVLYIRQGKAFPEIELFIKESCKRYNLDVISINGKIQDGLWELKKQHPGIEAVIMGTRITDPYSGHLDSFSMTDLDWPQFMRVNPMLHWSYSDLWTFLRSLNVPYCSLYDQGYTSLGCMETTHPNPALQVIDEKGIISYLPAYRLSDGKQERAGRN
ncbi:FAD synthase [Lamellibrachia satsuma]|nr:FAD synthase [Lamellibrachia satsuma]